MPSVEIDAGWTFAPIVLISLAGYLGVYFARWRTSRREGGARAASGWRLAAWTGGVITLFVALISPVDRLGEQLASMHMVQHLLIADIAAILFTLGLTRHILRPATRRIHRIERAAGPFASPWFGVDRLRRRHVALARPGDVRRRAAPLLRPHDRAPHASPPPASSTGGTC